MEKKDKEIESLNIQELNIEDLELVIGGLKAPIDAGDCGTNSCGTFSGSCGTNDCSTNA